MANRLFGIKNRKIRNATPIEYNGITFRSKLEKAVYIALMKRGITPDYEPNRIKIWSRDKFTIPYYDRFGKKGFKLITSKPLSVHYTPDFIFQYKEMTVYLEVKGFKNDVTPYKIRLFRDWLENNTKNSCYAVVYSLGDLNALLKDLDDRQKEN